MGLTLTKVSETASTITLGWTPPANVGGYVFYSDTTPVSTGTPNLKDGTPRREVKFSKNASGKYSVVAVVSHMGATEAGTYGSITQPPPGDYPASYFTGPLGQNNPVPPKGKCFLGVWGPGNDGGATSWTQYKANVLARQADMGRKYDIIMTVDLSSSEQAENRPQWIHSNGSIPAVHLGSGMTLSGVVAGNYNAQLDALKARWGSFPFTIMVRLFHEFEQPTSYRGIDNPPLFVEAWRYIVNRFSGADNVGFWWCPGEGADRTKAAQCWPGDEYVDWSGSDGYNWVRHGEPLYATPYFSGWAEFKDVFDYPLGSANLKSMHNAFGPRKPFVIGETGCTFDNQPNQGPTKGQWFKNIPASGQNMEYLCGVCFFDIDASSESSGGTYPERNDWRVVRLESIPSIYADWLTMARDPYFA